MCVTQDGDSKVQRKEEVDYAMVKLTDAITHFEIRKISISSAVQLAMIAMVRNSSAEVGLAKVADNAWHTQVTSEFKARELVLGTCSPSVIWASTALGGPKTPAGERIGGSRLPHPITGEEYELIVSPFFQKAVTVTPNVDFVTSKLQGSEGFVSFFNMVMSSRLDAQTNVVIAHEEITVKAQGRKMLQFGRDDDVVVSIPYLTNPRMLKPFTFLVRQAEKVDEPAVPRGAVRTSCEEPADKKRRKL